MNNSLFIKNVFLILILGATLSTNAQLLQGNSFMQGSYIEVGMAPNGAYGTTCDAPAGYHPRNLPITFVGASTINPFDGSCIPRLNNLGFVADPDKDGWAVGNPAYFGDYFVPGKPQEGFSIEINGVEHTAWSYNYFNNCVSNGFSGTLVGNIISQTNTGGIITTIWQGTLGALTITQTTVLNTQKLYFTTNVVLTNTGAVPLNNVYYERTVDPDNDVALTPVLQTFGTNNTIVSQIPNPTNDVLVSAVGTQNVNAYLGLGTRDCRAKSYINTGANVNVLPPDIPSSLFTNINNNVLLAGNLTSDVCIGLVYNLGTLATGASTNLTFAYILKQQDLAEALQQTEPVLQKGGVNYLTGANIITCDNDIIPLSLLNDDNFTWTWATSSGNLSNTSGINSTLTMSTTPATLDITGVSAGCATKQLQYIFTPSTPNMNTPADMAICQNQNTTLISFTGGGVGTVYNWINDNTAIGLPANGSGDIASFVATNASAAPIVAHITVTPTLGVCSGAPKIFSITINPLPIVTASISPTTLCVNDIATLSASGASTYAWSNGLAGASPTFSATATGTFSVTGTDGNNCSAVATTLVQTVNPLPPVTASVSPTPICFGDNATFTATGATSYVWSNANTASSFSIVGNNTITLSVTGTDGNGCKNAATALLTVNPLPVVTALVSPKKVCSGELVTVSATGGGNYAWNSGQNTASFILTGTQSKRFIVTVTDGNNCKNTASDSSTVFALPIPQIVASKSEICNEDTVTLTASGGTAYAWSSLENTATIKETPSITTTYSVTVSDINACSATASLQIIVDPLPVVKINPDFTKICFGKSVILTGTGAANYVWNTNETTAVINPSPTVSTSYSLIGKDAKNCINYDTLLITVFPLPIPNITQLNEQQCYGTAVGITATAGVSYLWNTTETTATISVSPTQNTTYSVTVTDAHNCVKDTSIKILAKLPYIILDSIKTPPCYPANIGSIALQVSGNNGGYQYHWSNGKTTSKIDSLGAGNFAVTVTDSKGCDSVLSYNLQYDYILKATISPADTSVPEGVYVPISSSVNVNNQVHYYWSNNLYNKSCLQCPNNEVKANLKDSIYSLIVIDKYGCTDTVYNKIAGFDISQVYIPNAFSPNGDGANDFHEVYGKGFQPAYIRNFEFKVFNRIGELIYETNDPAYKWDGTFKGETQANGVYIYTLNYTLMGIEKQTSIKGSITILR